MDEVYADVSPVRVADGGLSAFVSVMRGCNNMCAFCIVPFTRGRERSRDLVSVEEEVRGLAGAGYREITLLGQNVNSYHDASGARATTTVRAWGARTRRRARAPRNDAPRAFARTAGVARLHAVPRVLQHVPAPRRRRRAVRRSARAP